MSKIKWGGFKREMQKFENRDPWPQVPFADDLPKFGKWEAALYVVAGVVLLLFVLLGPGEL